MSAVLDTTNVHLGHWVNWSLGTVRGSTITLTRQHGALLTAFLAMFVSFAGTRIWKIAAFSIYLSLAEGSPQDALFHQRQAILRNSSTADEAFWNLLKVAWAWRKSNYLIYRRVGPLALVSLVAGLTFAVAGVFSSQISSAMGNEVLLSGHGCAWMNDSSWNTQDNLNTLQIYNSELIQDASQRAQQCYTSNTSTGNCQTFVKPSIPISVTRNASCPFDQKICQSNTANLVVDTGYLDSHYDFGVNAPLEKRITSRFIMHCAPLVLDGYSSVIEGPTNSNNTLVQLQSKQLWMQYYYGRTPIQPPHNFTYQYPLNVLKNASDFPTSTGFEKDYAVDARGANANNSYPESANFIAIPELSRTDADTILVFLSPNVVAFSGPVDDPWYSVHQGPFDYKVRGGAADAGTTQQWFADNPANVLGCTEQIQFCNPNLPLQHGCGPLTSPTALLLDMEPDVPPIVPPWRDQTEATRFRGFLNTWTWFSFYPDVIIGSLRSKALSSRNNFLNGIQGPLSHNQWQLDVENWFSTQLATLQRAFAEAANGPRYPGMETHLLPPQNNLDREFCMNQKILSTSYTSFSTLGLVLTFVIGGAFIAVSYFLEPILHWIQRRWRWDNYALTEWWINETLLLQSFVHEEIGMGTWTREIGTVPPITPAGERLATLDLSDPEHPRFKARRPTWAESLATESGEAKPDAIKIEEVGSSLQASSSGADTANIDAHADGHDAALNILGYKGEHHDSEHHDGKHRDSEYHDADMAATVPLEDKT